MTLQEQQAIDSQLKSIRMTDGRTYLEHQLSRARKVAIVLASTTIVSLIFLVFAFVQKAESDKIRGEAELLRAELELCRKGS